MTRSARTVPDDGGTGFQGDPPAWFGDDKPGDLFEIVDASLGGAPMFVEIFGPSESGKTLSALLLARGLAGDDEIGLMDTEAGRGRLFAKQIPGGYKYGWLRPPFTVENYERGIELFLMRCPKLRALVIDSGSHCWSAQGGVLDQVEAAEAKNVPMRLRWTKPKRRYNRFLDYLTTSRIHIIMCSRARQPLEERTVNGKQVMVPQPWQPIRSPSLRYDLTICLPMQKDGYYDLENPLWKCPGDLRHLFPSGPHRVSTQTGVEIARWVAGEDLIDVSLELLVKRAFDEAANGTLAMRKFYETLPRDQRDRLKPHLAGLQSAVRVADEAIELEQHSAADDPSDQVDMGNPFGRSGVQDLGSGTPSADRSAIWQQGKLVIEARDPNEFERLMRQYLTEARDIFDVNGLELDNADQLAGLFDVARQSLSGAIEDRRTELQTR